MRAAQIKEFREGIELIRKQLEKDQAKVRKSYIKKNGGPPKSETRKELYCRAQIELCDLLVESLGDLAKDYSQRK